MLLGLATIIGGTNPRAVGSILLFCFFAVSHINHEIESGEIARQQARLRSQTELYEQTLNGTFLLSSPEQSEFVKFQYASAYYIPWFTTLLFYGFFGALETFVTIWLWIIPVLADQDPDPRHRRRYAEAAKHPLLLKAISGAIIVWGFRDRLPTEWPWIS